MQYPTVDSVFVLKDSDNVTLPASVNLISETEIKGPFQKDYSYDRLLGYAKNEAKKQGGNLIKVIYFHGFYGTKYLRNSLKVKIFHVGYNGLSTIKMELDSAVKTYNASMEKLSIVHIKDYDDDGKRPVFFNNVFVTKIKGPGFDGLRKAGQIDLTFDKDGVLTIHNPNYNPPPIDTINIRLGEEYYIVLYTTLGHRQFYWRYKLVGKGYFYNKHMLFESIYEPAH